MQEYLFHADAGDRIDVEVRSVSDTVPDFDLTLFSPADLEIARAQKADSLISDGKLYPLADVLLDEAGAYRIVMAAAVTEDARFRLKARHTEPIAVDSATSSEDESTSGSLASTLLSTLADLASDLGPPVGLAEGNRAPDFAITTLAGEDIDLSDLRGKAVLLNFWGTWCGPCRREMPEFQKVYDEWSGRGFEILAISYNDTEAAMAAFRDEFGLSFPLALDGSGEINDAYAIQTRPSSYLIDQQGVIQARHFGIMVESQLNQLLAGILEAE